MSKTAPCTAHCATIDPVKIRLRRPLTHNESNGGLGRILTALKRRKRHQMMTEGTRLRQDEDGWKDEKMKGGGIVQMERGLGITKDNILTNTIKN